ncbi:MAG: hypothetical protein ACREXV_06120 [Polaromonas sp.]
MDILFILFLVFFFGLLAFWLVPSWKVLATQFSALFSRAPPGPTDRPETRPNPPRSPGKRVHDDPLAPGQKGKRHTVLPHQARGR